MEVVLPSDRAVAEVIARGGVAPTDVVEQALARRIGRAAAERAVGLAIVGRRLEEVRMVDGSPGLRLMRAAP
jgi:hypothetical protein